MFGFDYLDSQGSGSEFATVEEEINIEALGTSSAPSTSFDYYYDDNQTSGFVVTNTSSPPVGDSSAASHPHQGSNSQAIDLRERNLRLDEFIKSLCALDYGEVCLSDTTMSIEEENNLNLLYFNLSPLDKVVFIREQHFSSKRKRMSLPTLSKKQVDISQGTLASKRQSILNINTVAVKISKSKPLAMLIRALVLKYPRGTIPSKAAKVFKSFIQIKSKVENSSLNFTAFRLPNINELRVVEFLRELKSVNELNEIAPQWYNRAAPPIYLQQSTTLYPALPLRAPVRPSSTMTPRLGVARATVRPSSSSYNRAVLAPPIYLQQSTTLYPALPLRAPVRPSSTMTPRLGVARATVRPSSTMTPRLGVAPATVRPSSTMTPRLGEPRATVRPSSTMTPRLGEPRATLRPSSTMTPGLGVALASVRPTSTMSQNIVQPPLAPFIRVVKALPVHLQQSYQASPKNAGQPYFISKHKRKYKCRKEGY